MKKTVLVVVATAVLVSACTTTDPYTGDLPGAEPMTHHAPDDVCRFVARHRVADCRKPPHPGWTWDPTAKRRRRNVRYLGVDHHLIQRRKIDGHEAANFLSRGGNPL